MAGSHGWQGFDIASHRSAPSFAPLRPESRLAGGRGSPSHLPGRGGKSEAVYPMSLAALRGEGCVWSRRARGEGSGGEVKNALISRKGLVWSSKAISTKVKLSYPNFIYITWQLVGSSERVVVAAADASELVCGHHSKIV